MHALTVIVEFAAICAVLLIDNPVEPQVLGTIGGPATAAAPPLGFANKNGQQWPTICCELTSIGIFGVVAPAAINPYLVT
jgi:hypothetical protein